MTFPKITLQQAFSASILAIAFFLPLFSRVTAVFIIVLLLVWMADGNIAAKLRKLWSQRITMLFISVYVVYLAGMLFTSNIAEGLTNLLLKITLLLFPVIFFAPGNLKIPALFNILRAFIAGCLVTSLVMLCIAFFALITEGENHFFYIHLVRPLHIHPSVFSMYLIFCILCLLSPFFEDKISHLFRPGSLKWIFLIFFPAMLFLLSARQEVIAFLLLVPGLLLIYFSKRKELIWGIVGTLVIVSTLVLIIFLIPETKMRLEKMLFQFDEQYSNDAPNSVTMRKVIWKTSAEIISEKPFTGVGTGDVDDELKEKYKEKNLLWPLHDNLNAHNQYLQTAMAVGITGLLIFFASLLGGLRIATIHRHFLYLFFLLLFIFCVITESMLESEAGVVFFSFFNSLLAREAGR